MTTDRSPLEPADWDTLRRDAAAALEAAISHLEHRGARPVWRPVPETVKAAFREPAPRGGAEPAALLARFTGEIAAYDLGNTHPRFYGWVHGAGTPEAVIPAMLEAALNANLGGREHAAVYVERQVIAWCREIFGFPEGAGGLVVSGTSMATVLAMKAALARRFGAAIRDEGVAALPARPIAYASAEAHSCIAKAFDLLGLGRAAVRKVPVDAAFRMDTAALRALIAEDRAAGRLPFVLVGTAGTVNQGAIDPLDELAGIAAAEGLWYHVDGAFGALAVLSPDLAPRVAGIERADSLAFDFHKWLHVTYDAGFILMRDESALRAAFSERPDYLAAAERGLAAGNPWFTEYGPELSRGFRALKVWYQLRRFGLDALGAAMAGNCRLACHLAARVDAHPALERLAPVALDIVCFRALPPAGGAQDAADALNEAIVIALQERGLAAPSTTRLGGRLAIRVNLSNHRTTEADLDALVDDTARLAAEFGAG
jgi:glutamate/tyrosine decarboxylase-like PLP-dependent enzyme